MSNKIDTASDLYNNVYFSSVLTNLEKILKLQCKTIETFEFNQIKSDIDDKNEQLLNLAKELETNKTECFSLNMHKASMKLQGNIYNLTKEELDKINTKIDNINNSDEITTDIDTTPKITDNYDERHQQPPNQQIKQLLQIQIVLNDLKVSKRNNLTVLMSTLMNPNDKLNLL